MSQEFKIYHILVKHDYEAKDLLIKIKDQKSFELMAAKYSSCSSAKSGGLLGFYKAGRYVEAFEAAVLDLAFNKVSNPVRTQFGYHLIYKTI
jgi:parvulin-like peptidyl-prolyl isomerase